MKTISTNVHFNPGGGGTHHLSIKRDSCQYLGLRFCNKSYLGFVNYNLGRNIFGVNELHLKKNSIFGKQSYKKTQRHFTKVIVQNMYHYLGSQNSETQ